MPTWISDEKGLLHPAKEQASLVNRTNKTITIQQTDENGKRFNIKVKRRKAHTT